MSVKKVKIYLKAFDINVLKKAIVYINHLVSKSGSTILSTVAMPIRIHKYVMNKSPNIYKRFGDQFEQRIFKFLINITDINHVTINTLMKADLPSNIDVNIKL